MAKIDVMKGETRLKRRKLKQSGLHEGDKVIMHTCSESTLEKYKDKVFTCASEPWDLCGSEVIMIDGVRGGFATEYLRKV